MKKVGYIVLLLVAALSVWNFVEIQFFSEKQDFYFVDNHKLFDEFAMTKEYDQLIQQKFSSKEKVVDSLKFELQVMEKDLASNDTATAKIQQFYRKRNQFLEIKEQIEQQKSRFVSETKSKIWTRLNEYLILFGEQKQASIILGASGNGNIMYGKESLDLTEEAINFVNNEYNKK